MATCRISFSMTKGSLSQMNQRTKQAIKAGVTQKLKIVGKVTESRISHFITVNDEHIEHDNINIEPLKYLYFNVY